MAGVQRKEAEEGSPSRELHPAKSKLGDLPKTEPHLPIGRNRDFRVHTTTPAALISATSSSEQPTIVVRTSSVCSE